MSSARAVTTALATTTVTVLPVFLTGGLAVQISAELGFDPAGLGLVVALFFAVSAVVALPTARLVERFGGEVTARAGMLGVAAVLLGVAGLAHSYLWLVAILLCSAWCNVVGQLASNLTLARAIPPRRLGLSFGIKQAGIPLATLLAGAAVPTVALPFGWRWAFVAGAGLALAAFAIAPRGIPGRERAPAVGGESATAALAVLGLAAGLAAASALALGIFLVASAVRAGIDAGTAGLMLTLGSVVGLVVRLLHGWLADRRSGQHIAVVAASLLLGAGGMGLLAVGTAPTLLIGTVLGYGLGWAWPGLLQFAVVRLNPSAPAVATAVVQVGMYGGGFGGPIGFGLIAAHLGFTVAWLVAALAMAAAAGLMVLGRRMLLARPRPRVAVPALATTG